MIFIGLLIGLFIGGCVGVMIMAVISVAHESREEADRLDGELIDVGKSDRTTEEKL